MRLYDYYRSSAAYRVRIALNLKGVVPERSFIHLRKGEQSSPEFMRLNPQGLVPALAMDGAVLTQSLAIIEYLDETYPEPPFLPRDPLGRAQVRALALAIACDIHPLNNTRVLNRLSVQFGADQQAQNMWYRHWITSGLHALEQILAKNGTSGDFCHGSQVTLADICLIPQLFNARRFECDLSPYPILCRVDEYATQLPEFIAAHPSRQPDAE